MIQMASCRRGTSRLCQQLVARRSYRLVPTLVCNPFITATAPAHLRFRSALLGYSVLFRIICIMSVSCLGRYDICCPVPTVYAIAASYNCSDCRNWQRRCKPQPFACAASKSTARQLVTFRIYYRGGDFQSDCTSHVASYITQHLTWPPIPAPAVSPAAQRSYCLYKKRILNRVLLLDVQSRLKNKG